MRRVATVVVLLRAAVVQIPMPVDKASTDNQIQVLARSRGHTRYLRLLCRRSALRRIGFSCRVSDSNLRVLIALAPFTFVKHQRALLQ